MRLRMLNTRTDIIGRSTKGVRTMAMEFSKEQIEKAAACKSVAELRELAKSEGIELTNDEAETYFAELNNVRVSDAELDEVAGGKCEDLDRTYCPPVD